MDAALRPLLARPRRHALYPALRLLQRHLGAVGDELPPALTVRQSDSLAFSGAEIESLRLVAGADGATAVELVPGSGSLLGAHGALPLFYTELLAERGDGAARAFLDLFARRLAAAGYRAWRRNRPALQAEHPGRDALQAALLALAGQDTATAGEDRAALAFHAGSLAPRRNADAVERVLRHQLGVPVRLTPWIASRHPLPEDARPRLGVGAVTLGLDAAIGPRVEQRHLRVRLALGPLDRRAFAGLGSGSRGRQALVRWLHRLLGDAVEVELRLVLRADAVDAARLDAAAPPRLGCDAFVLSRPVAADREDAGALLFGSC